jgi:D-threo-aldose 1-dehydrogenase
MERRDFLTAVAGTTLALSPLLLKAQAKSESSRGPESLPMNNGKSKRYRPKHRIGLGGAIGLGNMRRVLTEREAFELLQTAWAEGIRYYDTSPWYGLGISERRHAMLLAAQELGSYEISSKIGRILEPDPGYDHSGWLGVNNFNYQYDYSASGPRRSIEDSLQRMGVPSMDIVFIHDLSPDNEDMGEGWKDYYQTALNGAMPELTKMREEGLIKGWGMGVNTIPPAKAAIEQADPDVILLATQYSLLKHDDALNQLFPLAESRDVSFVLGAPLNSGYLAGNNYYNYKKGAPEHIHQRREQYRKLAKELDVDLRTAALHFCNAPDVVSAILPGASKPEHIRENLASLSVNVPSEFWEAAKRQGLMEDNAPVPG